MIGQLDIQDDVEILGPGAGLLSINGGDNQKVLDINSNTSVQPTVVIQDLTIAGGSQYGIWNAGNLTLENCTATGGQASYLTSFAADVFTEGTLSLVNCTVSGNTGMVGIYGFGHVSVSNSTVSDNSEGGLLLSATASVDNSVITNNSGDTAGIYDIAGTLTVANSSISGNSTDGGGISIYLGNVTVTNCTIANNIVNNYYHGGGITNVDGTLTVENSTIADNVTLGTGGGVSTFLEQFTHHATTTLIDDTIAGNTASTGAGVAVRGKSTVIMSNSIVADNAGSEVWIDPDYPNSGGVLQLDGPNLVEGGLAGFSDVLSGDPLLAPLGDYGGPTQTMALQSGSPAIGQGIAVSGITTDQRGFALDSPQPDIGAFQSHPVVVNTTSDGTGSLPGDLDLRQAIDLADVIGAAATIAFDPTIFAAHQTIGLTDGPLELSDTSGLLPSTPRPPA